MMRKLKIFFCLSVGIFSLTALEGSYLEVKKAPVELPTRGLCAHRGAMDKNPENTLPAFREAIKAGAQMIEFDIFLTKDGFPVVIHDPTVDRTTNGTGRVEDLTFEEIRKLDAGSWKGPEFKGERIPTLGEALSIMPVNLWLNIHLKGGAKMGETVVRAVYERNRQDQAFLACLPAAAAAARALYPDVKVCNMDRKESSWDYVDKTIAMKADFIQLRKPINPDFPDYVRKLKKHGIIINYYGTDSPEELRELFEMGVDFPLANAIGASMKAVGSLGIKPLVPQFRD